MNIPAIFEYLAQWMVASSLLILLGGLFVHGTFRKSAVWRHHIWLCVLISVLSVPVTNCFQYVAATKERSVWKKTDTNGPTKGSQPVLFHSNLETKEFSSAFGSTPIQAEDTLVTQSKSNTTAPDLASRSSYIYWISSQKIQAIAVFIWVSGLAFLALKWIVGVRRLTYIVKHSSIIEGQKYKTLLHRLAQVMCLNQVPVLRRSLVIQTPMVIGIWRPCILLPNTESLEFPELEQVLEHECAHIKRLDPWMLLLQRLGLLIFWVNPLFHWLHSELSRAREELCDNHVLTSWEGLDYAQTLSKMAQLWTPSNIASDSLAIGFRKHHLVRRVESIFDESVDHRIALRPIAKILSGIIVASLTVTSITLVAELSFEKPDETSDASSEQVVAIIDDTEHERSKGYPAHLRPFIHQHISGDEIKVYPWVDESDHHRISKELILTYPIRYWAMSSGGKDGLTVSIEGAGALGLSLTTINRVNKLLADAYHEFRRFEGAHMRALEDNDAYVITRRGRYNKVLESYTFQQGGPVDQKISEVRARLKADLFAVLDKERANIIWTNVGQKMPDHLADFYTFQLVDLGTELNVRRYPFRRGRPSGQFYPESWDQYAPEKMKPILARWRNLVRESLDDDDGPVFQYPIEEPTDYSQLPESGFLWNDNASFLDIPKSTIPSLGLSGLDVFQRLSAEAISLVGLTVEEANFIEIQYSDKENQFLALQKKHFHPIEHALYNYQLDAFPEEAEILKEQWSNMLVKKFGTRRGKIMDLLVRNPLSYWAAEQMFTKSQQQDLSVDIFSNHRRNHLWLNEGDSSVQMKFTVEGNERFDLKHLDSNGVTGNMSGPIDRLPMPFKHLLSPQVVTPPKGAF